MESFVQDSPFYSGRDLYWLRPKVELTLEEKLYYCSCIRRNRQIQLRASGKPNAEEFTGTVIRFCSGMGIWCDRENNI